MISSSIKDTNPGLTSLTMLTSVAGRKGIHDEIIVSDLFFLSYFLVDDSHIYYDPDDYCTSNQIYLNYSSVKDHGTNQISRIESTECETFRCHLHLKWCR